MMQRLLIEVYVEDDDRDLVPALRSLAEAARREGGLRQGYKLSSADCSGVDGDWSWDIVKESR